MLYKIDKKVDMSITFELDSGYICLNVSSPDCFFVKKEFDAPGFGPDFIPDFIPNANNIYNVAENINTVITTILNKPPDRGMYRDVEHSLLRVKIGANRIVNYMYIKWAKCSHDTQIHELRICSDSLQKILAIRSEPKIDKSRFSTSFSEICNAIDASAAQMKARIIDLILPKVNQVLDSMPLDLIKLIVSYV